MRVALYARVSTFDQSTENQIRDISEYCISRQWDSPVIYEEAGLTGYNTKRPELIRLLKDARARKFDTLIVWKLDRLFRSLKDLLTTLQEFDELGIKFISLRDNIDLTTSSGRLMMQMLGAFAEFETSLIRERVRAGVRNAQAKGIKFGRRPVVSTDMHQEIVLLRAVGLSIQAISNKTGITTTSVHRAIKRHSREVIRDQSLAAV